MRFMLSKRGCAEKDMPADYVTYTPSGQLSWLVDDTGAEAFVSERLGRLEQRLGEMAAFYRQPLNFENPSLEITVVPDDGSRSYELYFRPRGASFLRLELSQNKMHFSQSQSLDLAEKAGKLVVDWGAYELKITDLSDQVIYHFQNLWPYERR